MEPEALLRTIAASVHGRYLVRVPETAGPWPVLFGFHGYAEDASINLATLQRIPETANWLLVAVQALHPFYTKNERVVASWMTRQDRELAIADNIAYVHACVDAVTREFSVTSLVVFSGFSQGVAMAYRAAAHLPASGVIALAGDVPLDVGATQRLPHVLIGRGLNDEWYTSETMSADIVRLEPLAASVETMVFAGGHEWTDAFAQTAGRYLTRLREAWHDARRGMGTVP